MKYERHLWRFLSAGLVTALLAGSVSAASYAARPDGEEPDINNSFRSRITARSIGWDPATPGMPQKATPDAPWEETDIEFFADLDGLPEQGGTTTPGSTVTQSFRIVLDGDTIHDSSQPEMVMEEGRKIPYDGVITFYLSASFSVAGGLKPGDTIEWNLGTFPGLNLEPEFQEPIILADGQTYFGEAYLHYYEEYGGILVLETVITTDEEALNYSGGAIISYTYESGFVGVRKETPLEFIFPGREDARMAILLPSHTTEPDDPVSSEPESSQEITEPETTVPETTAPTEPETTVPESVPPETTEPVNPEPTEPETTEPETTVPETTAPTEPETTAGRPAGGGSSGGHDEGVWTTRAPKPSEPTEPETTVAETTAAETVPPESSEVETTESREETELSEESEETEQETTETTDSKELEDGSMEVQVIPLMGGAVKNGEPFRYSIEIRNNGDFPVENIRIRDYIPKHTGFVSASDGGTWGILSGEERVTWKIDTLEPGESRKLEIELAVYLCTPEDYELEQTVYWQSGDTESVNSIKDPENRADAPGVTVR